MGWAEQKKDQFFTKYMAIFISPPLLVKDYQIVDGILNMTQGVLKLILLLFAA